MTSCRSLREAIRKLDKTEQNKYMNKVPNTNSSPAKDNRLIIIKKNKEQNIKKGKQKKKKKKKKKKKHQTFQRILVAQVLNIQMYEVHHENMPI